VRAADLRFTVEESAAYLNDALELLDEADGVYVGDYNPNVRPFPAVRARLRRRCCLRNACRLAWCREGSEMPY
jgi:LuxR family maltose regulon positive regulatory protein